MLQFVSQVQKRVSALFGSFGDVERKFISAKAKGWIFMTEEKDSPVETQPKQETENEKQIYCNAVVRKYGNSFWVCCSRCTHKLGKIAAVDEYMAKSAFEFQVKCTSCKAINVVNAKIPVELPVAREKCAADENDDCDAFKDNQEITT